MYLSFVTEADVSSPYIIYVANTFLFRVEYVRSTFQVIVKRSSTQCERKHRVFTPAFWACALFCVAKDKSIGDKTTISTHPPRTTTATSRRQTRPRSKMAPATSPRATSRRGSTTPSAAGTGVVARTEADTTTGRPGAVTGRGPGTTRTCWTSPARWNPPPWYRR